MDYKEALDYLWGHTNYEMVPRSHVMASYDLRRVFEILALLDNPHLKARSLHITGTNGKGSTSAMLASVLIEAGFKTGLYTSPHLITTRERFMINREMITESELADLMTYLKPEIEKVNEKATYGRLTVFEILTALAFAYFASNKCIFQVMEVGMGGRFDATNVIEPEVCFLTSISYDHTEVLGKTLTAIATEKCGIIKPGCVVVSHPQTEEASLVIKKTCQEKQVPLIRVGQEVNHKSISQNLEHQLMEIQGRLDTYKVKIPLLGPYQLDNTTAAVAGLEVLIEKGYRISKNIILKGLEKVDFPGRMQIVSRKPWIVVDGGHNPAAAHNLAEALKQYFKPSNSVLVFGIAGDKDISGVVRELAPLFQKAVITRANSPRSASPEALAAEFRQYGIEVIIRQTVPEALNEARSQAGDNDLVCVTGSLYVVGEALANIKKQIADG